MKKKLSLLLVIAVIFTSVWQPSLAYAEEKSSTINDEEGSQEEEYEEVDINSASIYVEDSLTYSGRRLKPRVEVTYDELTLEEGADYKLSYSNNVNIGTGSVTIKGIGYFKGSKRVNFKINPMSVDELNLKKIPSKLYTGKEVKPEIILKNVDTVLKEGKDYKVTYKNNIKQSDMAEVIIQGLGNYEGSRTEYFSILSTAAYSTIFEGEGTEEDPYLISTAEDLKKLADKVNSTNASEGLSFYKKYFILTNDIDIGVYDNWIPIGIEKEFGAYSSFGGSFDGQGHTISGLAIIGDQKGYLGLFGHTQSNISNLTVKGRININVNNSQVRVGGICATNSETMENCNSYVDINISNARGFNAYPAEAGGIGAAVDILINCTNYGDIKLENSYNGCAAGITAYGATAIGCRNFGNIIVAHDENNYGIAAGISCYPMKSLIGCYNVGKITDSYVEGVEDRFYFGNSPEVHNCYTGEDIKKANNIEATNATFLRYKSVFPNSKYIYKYVEDTENENNGYPILNLSIVTTVSADIVDGLAVDDCEIDEASLPLGYTSVDELKADMKSMLLSANGSINDKNIKYFDFILRYTNGPNMGEPVTKDNFPEYGIEIRLPYPEGTDADNYVFTILHVKEDGTSEFINGQCFRDYIQFHTDSFSPFAVGCSGQASSMSLANSSVSTILPQTYTGSEVKPPVFVYFNDQLLSKADYDITYSNNVKIGTAKISIAGKGNYTGKTEKTFTITKTEKTITGTSITLEKTSYEYDGKEKKPAVVVKDGSTTLTNGTDYTVSYKNNVNAGTANVTITGKDVYTGIAAAEFKITPKSISNMTIALEKTSYEYDGKEKKPAVTVKDGSGTLANGTDYTVTYKNNVNAGTATATINGKGNYKDSANKTFTIIETAKDKLISDTIVTLSKTKYTYTGKALKPAVTVKDGKATLKNGTDYTVAYKNNTNAGTATATITGKGSYTGSVTKSFTITKASNTVKASDVTKTYSAKKQTVSIKAKVSDSAKLTYKSNKKQVTVDKSGKITIAKKFVGKATITITSAETKNYKKTTKKITLKVNPKSVSVSSVKNSAAKKMAVKWKKNNDITGYQIQYSTSSKFAKAKSVTVSSKKTTSKTISKLTKGKKYYVRIRAYKTVSGTKYYSSWSAKKSVNIKK